jgi:hypothetical protein
MFVTLCENEPVDWSFGDGMAQYVVSAGGGRKLADPGSYELTP